MDFLGKIYERFIRPFALAGGLIAYVVFTWALQQNGFIRATEDVYLQIVAMWSIGFVALAIIPNTRLGLDTNVTVLIRTMWCNIGVVVMAVLVPDVVRIFMLVVTLFGLMYASLHLNRGHVAVMGFLTYLFYVLCSAGLASYTETDPEFEFFLGLGFGFILAGGSILIFEGQELRAELRHRNEALRETMGRLQEMALRDELTGVHNRRYILDVLNRQKSLADREQQGFTVCYCDLDHFKQVNDQFGHVTGDKALRQFAELATGVVRNIDYVARFGGEEFVLVLVGADEVAAENVANRLRVRTSEMWIPGTRDDFVLNVSIGVTSFRSGERVEDALNRADRALYSAKIGGRDRVVVADG
ncbi:MAG: diguanylate cyclase [Pseudomonadales bacterium]|nr:diguanylate cyclase [Pseudomonadales bacterium]